MKASSDMEIYSDSFQTMVVPSYIANNRLDLEQAYTMHISARDVRREFWK